MKRVVLRGELGKQFGRIHEFELNTPAEAIRALCANFEGFQQALISSAERGVGYMIQVGKDAISALEEINNPTGRFEDISITPVLVGAGGGGAGQIFAGIGLIAAAIITGGIASAGVALGGFMGIGTVGTAVTAIGASLVLSGTAQLLSPQPADLPGLSGSEARRDSFDPRNNDPADNRSSYIYNGAVNLTAQGNPVPLCYGRMRVGSVVVSAGITTADI